MARYVRVRVRSALQRSGLPDLDYAVNPYVGCEHACRYCYAPLYTRIREVAEEWGRVVYVKENLLEVLEREAAAKRRGIVGVATVTDPYQPVEARERLTRGALEILLGHGFHVSVQTKSDLVLRDLDVLTGRPEAVDVGFTVTTLSVEKASLLEPGAPPPYRRVEALRRIAGEGLETWVFLGPIVPGVNDDPESIRGVVAAAAEAGAEVLYDYLRLKPGVADRLAAAGLPGDSLRRAKSISWRRLVAGRVEAACRELGARCSPAFPPRRERRLTEFFQ